MLQIIIIKKTIKAKNNAFLKQTNKQKNNEPKKQTLFYIYNPI